MDRIYNKPLSTLLYDLGAPSYDEDYTEERRKRILTTCHSIPEKMELYNCSTKGTLEDLTNIVTLKKYSLVEEATKTGYYWTVFHYASHYGYVKVLEYLLDHFDNRSGRYEIFNL
jgi:hypothetical protein